MKFEEQIENAEILHDILERLRNNQDAYHILFSNILLHIVGYDNYPDLIKEIEEYLNRIEKK